MFLWYCLEKSSNLPRALLFDLEKMIQCLSVIHFRYLAIKFQEMEEKMQHEKNRNRINNNNDENETDDETTATDSTTEMGGTDTFQTEIPSTVSSEALIQILNVIFKKKKHEFYLRKTFHFN